MKSCKSIGFVVALAISMGFLGCSGGGGSSNHDTFSIGGEVTGTSGTLILQNNGTDNLEITADGDFIFSTQIANGNAYSVTVFSQPEGRTCSVVDGEGTIDGENIIDVDVQCYETVEADISYLSKTATISWNHVGALEYEVYYSTNPDFEATDCDNFSDGICVADATSPLEVNGLTNGNAYIFGVRAIQGGGHTTESNRIVARPDMLVVNDEVKAMIASGGLIYIGGIFDRIGPRTGSGVPLDKERGGIALSMASFPIVNGDIWTAISDGSGGFYIGGYFTRVGNIPRNYVAHILNDGTLDLDFDPNTDYGVSALAMEGDTVYMGGSFSSVGGLARDGLAAVGTNGTLLDWSPDISGGAVTTMVVNDGVLYIGGSFTQVDGELRNYLAAIDTDNGELTSWSPSANSTVTKLAAEGNTVYVGGNFSSIDSASRTRLAAIGVDGSVKSWNPSPNGSVQALETENSILYVGGNFSQIDGRARSYVAAFDTNGALMDWAPEPGYQVYTLAADDGTVYMGGQFTSIDSEARNYLAAIDSDGNLLSWQPEPDDIVSVLCVSGDTLYAGGSFRSLQGSERSGTAAISTDGTLASWDPGVGGVFTMAMGDDIIYLGGRFTSIGGQTRNRLAAVDLDGNLTAWNPNQKDISFSDYIFSMVYINDTIFIGGAFSEIGLTTRNNAAAIDTSGALTTWNPNTDDDVYSLAATTDTIYLGGEFTNLSSTSRVRLAAMTFAGSLYSAFRPEANNEIHSLAVSGGIIYAGGLFTTIDSINTRQMLAAFASNGDLSTSWSPSVSGYSVDVVTVSNDTVYIGGEFNQIGSNSRNSLAAVGTNGTIQSWNPDVKRNSFMGSVNAIVVVDGTVYVGGRFNTIGDEVASNFAAIDADGILVE